MLEGFESLARLNPDYTCFVFSDARGVEDLFSYRETRMLAAATARILKEDGVRPRDCVVVDLPNCQAFILLVLAAAYGGFSLIILDDKLSEGKKLSLISSLEKSRNVYVAAKIDKSNMGRLEDRVLALFSKSGAFSPDGRIRPSAAARMMAANGVPRSEKGLGRANPGRDVIRRREEEQLQDSIEGVMHYAEHRARMFRKDDWAIIVPSAQKSGTVRMVPLTWRQLEASLYAFDQHFRAARQTLWQIALPLSQVDSVRLVAHCFKRGFSFIAYETSNADLILSDGRSKGASRIVVDNNLLERLLDHTKSKILRSYDKVLLCDTAPDFSLCKKAHERGLPLYDGYGLPETGGQVAFGLVDGTSRGALSLLPGYTAFTTDAGPDGFGRLAIQGPSVFEGYLDGGMPFLENSFVSDDEAIVRDGLVYVRLHVREHTAPAGWGACPAQIEATFEDIPGVAKACVIGAADDDGRQTPIAFVQRKRSQESSSPVLTAAGKDSSGPLRYQASSLSYGRNAAGLDTMSNHEFAGAIKLSLASRLPEKTRPEHVFVVNSIPVDRAGRIDASALEAMFEERLKLKSVRVTLLSPRSSGQGGSSYASQSRRGCFVVEVCDHKGRRGIGEKVTSSTASYMPSPLEREQEFLQSVLIPLVLQETFLHPSELSRILASYKEASAFPQACAAFEVALWDLYGHITQQPLCQMLQQSLAVPRFGAGASGPMRRVGSEGVAGSSGPMQRVGSGGVASSSGPMKRLAPDGRSYYASVQGKYSSDASRSRSGVATICVSDMGGIQPTLSFIREAQKRRTSVRMGAVDGVGILRQVQQAFQQAGLAEVDAWRSVTGRLASGMLIEDVREVSPAADGRAAGEAGAFAAYGIGCSLDRDALAFAASSSLECVSS